MGKKERFEKTVMIFMVMAIWLLAGMSAYIPRETESTETAGNSLNEYPGIIRFHVIANSDSEEDQELKLGVRDYVLPKIEEGIVKELKKSREQVGGQQAAAAEEEQERQTHATRKYVRENLEQIRRWAEEYISECGFEYKVQTQLGIREIPAKQYDDLYFPAGNYEALTITIGEGAGQNWWCVVFPPLCLIDCKDSAYKEKFETDGHGRIVLKSKIKDLIQKKENRRENHTSV